MKTLILGDKRRFDELLLKLPKSIHVQHFYEWQSVPDNHYELIFDLNFDDFPNRLSFFAGKTNIPVFACAVKKSLAQQVFDFGGEVQCNLIGMNLLPGFINREIAEVSFLTGNNADSVLQQLGWKYKAVEDRVGMIAPRIVCMIINEACYTLQEGTASMQDIDVSMKLGTNYPHGPFEWADKIGIKDVYETLDAIWQDTRDERYKICPLLKTKYLRGERFY